MLKQRHAAREIVLDILCYIAGGAIFSISVNSFNAPNGIVSGGVTGLATILNYLLGLPIGVTSLVINIPIFIAGAKMLGRRFLIRSVTATVILSVLIDVLAPFLPVYRGDKILTCIYGGVLSGTGLALVLLRDSTTGGTDIIAKLLNRKLPHISMGKWILALDIVIICGAALAYWNIENALYAVLMIFISTKVIDTLLSGADHGQVLLITSQKYKEISERIMQQMDRGVTLLDGTGAYTGNSHEVILCAVRRQEAARVRRIVREIDKDAFVVSLESNEILGTGFKQL